MYLGKRCHHSALLKALEVPSIMSIESLIEKQLIGLLKRAFRVKSPYTDLVIELISKYIVMGIATRGTFIGQLVESGHAPLTTAFDSASNDAHGRNEFSTDIKSGLIDSLKYVVDNVVRPGDANHTLLYNQCKCTSWSIRNIGFVFAEFPHSRQGELVLTIRPVGMGEFCFTEDFITVFTRNILLSELSLPASTDCIMWSWLFIWSLRLCLPFDHELAFKHISSVICALCLVYVYFLHKWRFGNKPINADQANLC